MTLPLPSDMTPEQALATALRSCGNHPWMVLPGPVDITGTFVTAAMQWFAANNWELRRRTEVRL